MVKRWLRRAGALLAGLASVSLTARPALASNVEEYEVKAAFLYNFAKFVEWPAASFDDDGDRMFLCILGSDPFGALLESVVSNKKAQGRALSIRRVQRPADVRSCHVLFFSASDEWQLQTLHGILNEAHVLTVGETDDFAGRGGIISFLMDGNKVRFEINADAAAKAGLQISSQLLKLATHVIPSGSASQ